MCEERWRGKREGRKRLPGANTPIPVSVCLFGFSSSSSKAILHWMWLIRSGTEPGFVQPLYRKPEITAVSYQLHYPAAYSILAKTKHELPSSLLGLSPISPS